MNKKTSCWTSYAPNGVFKNGDQTWDYDGQGKTLKVLDEGLDAGSEDDVVSTFKYDSLGYIIGETQSVDGIQNIISRAFDKVGNRLNIQYPSGMEVDYNRDKLNRLKHIYVDQELKCSLDYLGYKIDSRTITTHMNEIHSDWFYDSLMRITDLSHGNSNAIAEYSYLYDREGNVLRESRNHPETNESLGVSTADKYLYDDINRLFGVAYHDEKNSLSIVNPEAWTSIQYDEVGNWKEVSKLDWGETVVKTFYPELKSDGVNAYGTFDINTFDYDQNGQTTIKNSHGFTYDSLRRLVGVNANISYSYDAFNRRVRKTANNETTRYFYDGTHVIEEDKIGKRNEFVYGPGIDKPLMMKCGSDEYYYISDRIGSIDALCDGNGNLIERYRTDVYGDNLEVLDCSSGTLYDISQVGNPYYFQGRRLDQETRYYFYRSRYYDPEIGRFTTPDPKGQWHDVLSLGNRYSFAGNSPARFLDPYGFSGEGDNNGKQNNKITVDIKLSIEIKVSESTGSTNGDSSQSGNAEAGSDGSGDAVAGAGCAITLTTLTTQIIWGTGATLGLLTGPPGWIALVGGALDAVGIAMWGHKDLAAFFELMWNRLKEGPPITFEEWSKAVNEQPHPKWL